MVIHYPSVTPPVLVSKPPQPHLQTLPYYDSGTNVLTKPHALRAYVCIAQRCPHVRQHRLPRRPQLRQQRRKPA